jgi:heme-degrading monooxygenase HmoA
MYATIRSYSGQELADALATREDDIRQVISTIDGFRAYYLVRTTGGNAVTVSIFDDQAGTEESTRAAAAWVAENMAGLAPSPPQVTTGEVVFSL